MGEASAGDRAIRRGLGFRRRMNPLSTTGLLTRLDNGREIFLGTAFGFRTRRHFLTAAHCVGDLDASSLAIVLPRAPAPGHIFVKTIDRHPKADLALLTLVSDAAPQGFLSTLSPTEHLLGIDFFAYGFPENVLSVDQREPTPRLFAGIFQRYLTQQSFMGYSYEAAELSIPAPAGLSGGPVFHAHGAQQLIGIVTENFDSTTTLESIEEINARNEKRTIRNQRVISYGVTLLLDPLLGWLESYVPSAQVTLDEQSQADQET
jgi:hypothetical protein